jgi:hypothetical protein
MLSLLRDEMEEPAEGGFIRLCVPMEPAEDSLDRSCCRATPVREFMRTVCWVIGFFHGIYSSCVSSRSSQAPMGGVSSNKPLSSDASGFVESSQRGDGVAKRGGGWAEGAYV